MPLLYEREPEDCNEVTGCAGNDEEVPDKVAIEEAFGREKSDTRGVSYAAGRSQNNPKLAHGCRAA